MRCPERPLQWLIVDIMQNARNVEPLLGIPIENEQ